MAQSMGIPILLYKSLGETPLECLSRLRESRQEYKSLKMTYAGRLDPMAEGLLLALLGDDCQHKDEYTKLDKTYVVSIVVGVATDSYDLLGMVTQNSTDPISSEIVQMIQNELPAYVGTFEQKFPPFSSKTVGGVPLFELAKSNKTVALPSHEVSLYSIDLESSLEIKKEELYKNITERIALVHGDFRQGIIQKRWEEIIPQLPAVLPILTLSISCGSGFYVRQFIHDLGNNLGILMTVYSILRTRVGQYEIKNALRP